MKIILFSISLFAVISCKSQLQTKTLVQKENVNTADTTFVNIKNYSTDFVLDMKYATTDNFLKTKVYDCEMCFLRYKTLQKLLAVNVVLAKKGIKIKFFDCYRPLDIQKKMWQLVPNPDYVANPARGSMHNRGTAVDITLVDTKGTDFDMGTPFDFFGVEASHSYQKLTDTQIANRIFLKTIMLENGFKPFDTEWWHYSLIDGASEKLANFKWTCD